MLLLGIHTLTQSPGVQVAERGGLPSTVSAESTHELLLQDSKSSDHISAAIGYPLLSLFCAPSPHKFTFAETISNPQSSVTSSPPCPCHRWGHWGRNVKDRRQSCTAGVTDTVLVKTALAFSIHTGWCTPWSPFRYAVSFEPHTVLLMNMRAHFCPHYINRETEVLRG